MARCSLCNKQITSGYCVCRDCYSGYFVADKLQEQKLPDKPMTNGDKLRAMTNEELSKHFVLVQYRPGAPVTEKAKELQKAVLDWLNAPAE